MWIYSTFTQREVKNCVQQMILNQSWKAYLFFHLFIITPAQWVVFSPIAPSMWTTRKISHSLVKKTVE